MKKNMVGRLKVVEQAGVGTYTDLKLNYERVVFW